jgi:hypothetical protein
MVQVEKEELYVGIKFYAYKLNRPFDRACF